MRNRGYRFIIRNIGFQQGRCALCINSTWINHLLEEHGIDLRIFRRMTWEDLSNIQASEKAKTILEDLRPRNFWQMCDALTLCYARYEWEGKTPIYQEPWFAQYPVMVLEDVYEILLDEGYSQADALEITDFFAAQHTKKNRRDLRDLLELYDVPEDLSRVLLSCRRIGNREQSIRMLMSQLVKVPALVEQSGRNR